MAKQTEIVWKIMAKIGYPPIFINWLRALYVGTTAKILNGRKAAGNMDGVSCLRQGCALSMHLFVLYMDPLLIKLDEVLEGIPIPDEQVKVRALVDDLMKVLVNSLADVENTETVTDSWCCWTGASVNRGKSNALALGSWKKLEVWPAQWLTRVEFLPLLGIPFSASIAETSRCWNVALGRFISFPWSNIQRQMTLYQRASWVLAFGLSKTLYLAQALL